jgi:hypothetical protein
MSMAGFLLMGMLAFLSIKTVDPTKGGKQHNKRTQGVVTSSKVVEKKAETPFGEFKL